MQNGRTDGWKKNTKKTSRDVDYEEDGTVYDSDENYANYPETKPIRDSRYDPSTDPKSVTVLVDRYEKKYANSGTQSAQNETDKNAQFSDAKARCGGAYRLVFRCDLCEL